MPGIGRLESQPTHIREVEWNGLNFAGVVQVSASAGTNDHDNVTLTTWRPADAHSQPHHEGE